MKIEFPKMVYSLTKEPKIIDAPPIPEGFFASHADYLAAKEGKDSPVVLEDMTKAEIEELGREHGIELDKRLRKDKLIAKLQEVL